MKEVTTIVQAVTFLALGGLLLAEGNWRLGSAQFLLAAITVLVYL